MRRKPTFAPHIGSISSGTMRPEDLVPAFASELASLLKACRVGRATRKEHVKLVNEANYIIYCRGSRQRWRKDHIDGEAADDMLDELFTALEEYAPPYCWFGASEGDGADYGFWPYDIEDQVQAGNIGKAPDGAENREFWGKGDVYLVNDHGNVTCGRFDRRGRFHKYWSCV